jgi:hypothetical protein
MSSLREENMNRSLLIAAILALGLTACGKKEEKVVTPPPSPAPTAPSTTAPSPTPTPAPGADTTTTPGTGATGSSSSSSSSTTPPMGSPTTPASPSESKPDEMKK